MGLLLSNIPPHRFLIKTYGTYAISPRPKMHPRHALVTQKLPMYPHRTLPFDKPYHKRHTIFGGNA